MFRSMKYQNPVVREHMASHYAMGLLTPRVKRRVEAWMEHDASFHKEVLQWQERLSPLNDLPPAVTPPAYVRRNVLAAIAGTPQEQVAKRGWSWLWRSLPIWQGVSLASMALVAFLVFSPVQTTAPVSGKLAYVAVMQTMNGQSEPPLVISAYAKTESTPSRLELRWNDRVENTNVAQATLWAVDRDTGDVSPLMTLADNTTSVALTASQWKSVQNSLELVVTSGEQFDSPVLLRGVCLQLADWTSA